MIVGPLATVRYAVDGLIVANSVGEPEGVNVGALLGTSEGVKVSKPLGDTEGNAVLGTPVLPEPLATVGYAVDGVRMGVLMGEMRVSLSAPWSACQWELWSASWSATPRDMLRSGYQSG